MRRAKVVATLGPATSSYEQIRAIIDAGVDVARMNLSHGSYDVHEGVYQNVRKAANDSGRAVAVLVDLQGPKIRLGKFADGPHELAEGDIFKITVEDIPGKTAADQIMAMHQIPGVLTVTLTYHHFEDLGDASDVALSSAQH